MIHFHDPDTLLTELDLVEQAITTSQAYLSNLFATRDSIMQTIDALTSPPVQSGTPTRMENDVKIYKISARFISENIQPTAIQERLKTDLCFDVFNEYVRTHRLQPMLDAAAKDVCALIAEATGEVKSYSYIAEECGQEGKAFVSAFRKQFSGRHRAKIIEHTHKALGLRKEEIDGTRSIYSRWLNAQLGFIVDY